MSSQMLRQEIRSLAGPNVLLADTEDELRNQLANLNKESTHAEETQESQTSETGSEEAPQGRQEEKTEISQESPSGQESSKDS